MTVQEAKEMIEELKAQGNSEEEIVAGFYMMFTEDKITIEELGDLVQLVGYELTDEFRNMSAEDQKTKGWADEDELAEDNGNEGADEGNDKGNDEPEKGTNNDNEKSEENENSEESEDEQRAKAKKLFGLN